ncbi:MAG TPA: AP2 domain-containing protein [Flavobacteriales bacterium]|nr:AP2 domain-containing protein [Flavobacteriales bacterium]
MFKEVIATEISIKRRSIIYGMGTNDSWYMTQRRVNGKVAACKIYTTWKNMIKRCSEYASEREKKFYSDCSVCGEWLYFDSFYQWTKKQDWKGKQLDKDLLVEGNKIYSPETCVFVHQSINKLIMDNERVRGDYPQGVDLTPWGFRAKISINGKHTHLGYFDSIKDASICYAQKKCDYIEDMCEMVSDERVSKALCSYGYRLLRKSYAS